MTACVIQDTPPAEARCTIRTVGGVTHVGAWRRCVAELSTGPYSIHIRADVDRGRVRRHHTGPMRRRGILMLALGAAIAMVGAPVSAGAAVPAGGTTPGSAAVPAGDEAPVDVRTRPDFGERQRFDPPLSLDVVRRFLPPATRYGSGHRGVDLAAEPGTSVRAAGDGVVIFAGQVAGRGVVSIEHDGGLRTTYEPVRAQVSAGDIVRRGQLIGALQPGHPSCPAAACLHLGARLPDRVYLDPLALFRIWQVRLKPWDGLPPGG